MSDWFSSYNRVISKTRLQEPVVIQPYFCKRCGRQWQYSASKGKNKSIPIYYDQGLLPTIGKERRLCPDCEALL